jgi:hypothetical protein
MRYSVRAPARAVKPKIDTAARRLADRFGCFTRLGGAVRRFLCVGIVEPSFEATEDCVRSCAGSRLAATCLDKRGGEHSCEARFNLPYPSRKSYPRVAMVQSMPSDPNAPPPRVEVITSVQHRCWWSAAVKVRLVEETIQPGMSVSYVARRAGVAPSLLRRRMLERGL